MLQLPSLPATPGRNNPSIPERLPAQQAAAIAGFQGRTKKGGRRRVDHWGGQQPIELRRALDLPAPLPAGSHVGEQIGE